MFGLKIFEIRKAVSSIIESLQTEPTNWAYINIGMRRVDGISIWSISGRCNCEIYEPVKIKLSWWEKRVMWKAIRRWGMEYDLVSQPNGKGTPLQTAKGTIWELKERVRDIENNVGGFAREIDRRISNLEREHSPRPIPVNYPDRLMQETMIPPPRRMNPVPLSPLEGLTIREQEIGHARSIRVNPVPPSILESAPNIKPAPKPEQADKSKEGTPDSEVYF